MAIWHLRRPLGRLGAFSVVLLTVARAAPAQSCCPGDFNNDGLVTIDEILTTVNAALNGCGTVSVPCQSGGLLSTGQTRCDQGGGTLGACPGSPGGQDAAVRAGVPLSYVDNGDGTIQDLVTGLTWEKIIHDGSIHDLDNTYTWYDAFRVKIEALNNHCEKDETVTCASDGDCAGIGGSCGFAGHRDWRLPNRRELESLVDLGRKKPTIDPMFESGCTSGCTVKTCSCTLSTESDYYWSSTTWQDPALAWAVSFNLGDVNGYDKVPVQYSARAVRGGL